MRKLTVEKIEGMDTTVFMSWSDKGIRAVNGTGKIAPSLAKKVAKLAEANIPDYKGAKLLGGWTASIEDDILNVEYIYIGWTNTHIRVGVSL